MTLTNSSSRSIFFALAAVGLFAIITFALSAATLGTVNKGLNEVNKKLDASISTDKDFLPIQAKSTLAQSVLIDDLMAHLTELEKIGKESENNRAIGTPGFQKTVNYIDDYLRKNAYDLNVFREPFPVTNFSIDGTPRFSWSEGGGPEFSFKYSSQLAEADFTPVNYSAGINSTSFQLFIVKNTGCNASDWTGVADGGIKRAALVIAGGWCTYAEKGEFAASQSAGAIIFYNHGLTTSSLAPAIIRLRQKNQLPAIFLSSSAGRRLIDAMNETKNNVTVRIDIQLKPYGTFPVENICADTKFGDPNEIIIVGSHSDSVPPGPGINDNGSGSAANLVLAANLARLARENQQMRYKYRVRFCWWGAEEIGLVGAIYHVDKAVERNELKKYLVNLNFDMLASPNFMFGIYDGRTANPLTPAHAINGSIRISEAFRDWFNEHRLPFDYTDFSGRSDYGPFLRQGIVAGGLFSGADDTKSMDQRKQYEQRLGSKQAGLAGAIHDPCYHRLCDNIDNIDPLGFLTMVQAAADILDHLGHQPNLTEWLYPNGRL